jgi:hypothetical protein
MILVLPGGANPHMQRVKSAACRRTAGSTEPALHEAGKEVMRGRFAISLIVYAQSFLHLHSAKCKIFLSVKRKHHELGDRAADCVGEESERVCVLLISFKNCRGASAW